MRTGKRRARRPAGRKTIPALERRIGRLLAEREAETERHRRQLARLRRAADRRLTSLVREITALRHHEARAEALSRLLAGRDQTIAAQADRIAHLETLLQNSTSPARG